MARLFLNLEHGGLDLPISSVSFKNLQTSCLLRFTNFNDSCLKALANAKVERVSMMATSRFVVGECPKDLEILGGSPNDAQLFSDRKVREVRKYIRLRSQEHLWNHLTLYQCKEERHDV